MYQSLVATGFSFGIYAFCMDDECYNRMNELNLYGVIPVSIQQLEVYDKELASTKSNRSLVEYYFTCTPAICNYVIGNYPELDYVTYLDADLYFFSSPQAIFDEIGNASIAIVEHRFSRFGRRFIKNGRFNVAWITFKNNAEGLMCILKYRQQCIDWCYDYLDGDKYGDQKYLDKWPQEYNRVHIIQNLGVNLAPWNLAGYNYSLKNGKVFVNDYELVFFHFAGLKQLKEGVYTTSVSSYFEFIPSLVKQFIYTRYLNVLRRNTSSWDITPKTINPKYLRFSIRQRLKGLFNLVRIWIFNDIVRA